MTGRGHCHIVGVSFLTSEGRPWIARRLRGEPAPFAKRGLSDAGLAERSGRCRRGKVAPAEPADADSIHNLRGVVDDRCGVSNTQTTSANTGFRLGCAPKNSAGYRVCHREHPRCPPWSQTIRVLVRIHFDIMEAVRLLVRMSNSIFTSSFTFTVPPAMAMGVIPNSCCLRVALPR